MKYAFCSFSTSHWPIERIIKEAGTWGYDGVEPRLDANHGHGIEVTISPERRREIRSLLQGTRFSIAELASSLQMVKMAEDDFTHLEKILQVAEDVNCGLIRVFGGEHPGLSKQEAVAVVKKNLKRAAKLAEQSTVKLTFETHDAWTDPVLLKSIFDELGSSAAGINWDIMHGPRTGYSIEQSFESLKEHILHVHIHDAVGDDLEWVPIGQGRYDHQLVMRLLSSIGYSGYLSGEWIDWTPPEVHLPGEIKTLKEYERHLSSFQ